MMPRKPPTGWPFLIFFSILDELHFFTLHLSLSSLFFLSLFFRDIMTSNVLVTGASGLLGRQVFSTFQHSGVLVVGQGFTRAAPPTVLKADLEKEGDIKNIFNEVKFVYSCSSKLTWYTNNRLFNSRPQIVIHCKFQLRRKVKTKTSCQWSYHRSWR